jgi:hypothetical protein
MLCLTTCFADPVGVPIPFNRLSRCSEAVAAYTKEEDPSDDS